MKSAHAGISGTVTLVPRLQYSGALLDGAIGSLQEMGGSLRASGRVAARQGPSGQEVAVASALEAAGMVRRRAGQISGVASIPDVLPASIQVVRTASAGLYGVMPGCSRVLSELSVHLGSIVLDSAAITHARFDFGRSNSEAAAMLERAGQMAGSALKRQYPDMDFSGECAN